MKKNYVRYLIIFALFILIGCSDENSQKGRNGSEKSISETAGSASALHLTELDDIKDKRIGVLLGSIHDLYARKHFPNAKILQYQNFSDLVIAVNSKKIDVAFFGHVYLPEVLQSNPEVGIFIERLYGIGIGAGFNKENTKLRDQFNAFLVEIKSNGIYADMVNRYMDKRLSEMPEIKGSDANGELKTGIVSEMGVPFAFIKNGRIAGFDFELATRFAASLGKKLVPVDMHFASLLAAVSTNKIDLITSSLAITDERKKQIDFSDPYFDSATSLIARKENIEGYKNESVKPNKPSFIKSVADSFYNNIILEKRYLLILDGLEVTILISILSALLGTLIGALICFMRMSKSKLLSLSARFYISLIRGTPVLVLLMIIFYIIFGSVNINANLVAIIAFGLNFGAYVSEMFRTSIQNIDNGQHEAGIASGFSGIQTFIYIIMPQAIRQVLPVYKGEFISLLKMTSVVGYIAVQDLTKASDIIRSRTFDAFFPLIMAAVLYIIIAGLMTWGLSYMETTTDPRRKRINKELEVNL